MIDSPLLPHTGGYIDGRWINADKRFSVRNPATGELLAEVAALGPAETTAAIAAARNSLSQPADLERRRGWLNRIAEVLVAHREEIGRILTLEHGKPWPEAQSEVDYAAGFFRQCAEQIEELAPHRLASTPRNCRWTVYYRPAGVAALITPWNFPIGMIAKKLSAALAADCPSVIKPSSKTPLTMIALFTLLDRELDLPPGRVNLVTGPAGPISDTLMAHPHVRVISFTGSTEVGKQLISASAGGVKKLALELGGNAPFIVFEDADLDRAADQLIANKFRGGGQTCVCANRVYVQRSVEAAFADKLASRIQKLKVGYGMEPGVDIGPLIDRAGWDKVSRHLDDVLAHGGQIVSGARPPEPKGGDWGCFFPPVLVRGVTHEMACTREETFGPLVPLIGFDSEDEVIRQANDTEFGLAAYVFTNDRERGLRVVSLIEAGHVGLNTGTGPAPEAAFGGWKQSGYGREGGREGLFEFVEPQTVPEPV